MAFLLASGYLRNETSTLVVNWTREYSLVVLLAVGALVATMAGLVQLQTTSHSESDQVMHPEGKHDSETLKCAEELELDPAIVACLIEPVIVGTTASEPSEELRA